MDFFALFCAALIRSGNVLRLFCAAFACLPCNFAVQRQEGKGAEGKGKGEGVNSNCICLLRQRHSLPAAAAAVTAIFKGRHMEIGGWPKKSCKKERRKGGAGTSC